MESDILPPIALIGKAPGLEIAILARQGNPGENHSEEAHR